MILLLKHHYSDLFFMVSFMTFDLASPLDISLHRKPRNISFFQTSIGSHSSTTTLTLNTSFHIVYSSAMSDDGEQVNVKVQAEKSCEPKCIKEKTTYDQCVRRIEGKDGKHCSGYAFDYWGCIDKCAAPKYFPKLK